MNARLLLTATFLLAAPMVLAQQPAPSTDATTPPPPHQQMQGPMQHAGGPMAQGHSMSGMHHEMHGGPGGPGGSHSEFWKNPEVAARLALTPDQVKRLDEIATKGKIDEIHLHAALEEDEVLMRPLVEGATFDEHKADAQIDKIADAHAALEKAMAKNRISMHAVLTADQWTKLHTPEHHEMHRGMGHGEGPQGAGPHQMGMDEGGSAPDNAQPQPSM